MTINTTDEPSPPNVLLLESGWLRRQLGAQAIRRAGARVFVAAKAEDAFEHLEHTRFDIAVLACDAASCEADRVLSHLQRHTPGVYCIALSYTDAEDQMERHFAVGFDDFIQRPLSAEGIRVLLDTASEVQHLAALSQVQQPALDDDYAQELHPQLLGYLHEETDALFDMLRPERFERDALRRGMHRMRSGLLLVGYRALADECLDLERDCEQSRAPDVILARRGWRVARQIRALHAHVPATSTHSHTHTESGQHSTSD